MNIFKIICIILITSIFTSCGSGNQKASSLFEIKLENNLKQINQNQEIRWKRGVQKQLQKEIKETSRKNHQKTGFQTLETCWDSINRSGKRF